MGLYDFTFYDVIVRNARLYRHQPAWLDAQGGRLMTFAQIKTQVDRLACGLQSIGIRKGERIGVVGQNRLEFFLLYGAAAALGAIVVPINWRLSAEEAAFNLSDVTPAALFVDPAFEALADTHEGSLSGVDHRYALSPGQGDFTPMQSLMENEGTWHSPGVSAEDAVVIIHTAAVAGRPRGAVLSHGNLMCAHIHLLEMFQATADDVHLNLLPLFHVAGLFMATAAFHCGALNVNMHKFDAEAAVGLIATHRASLMFDFSPILGSILDAQASTGEPIGSLRGVLGLEAPETIDRYQDLTGGTFYSMFGQTETSLLATTGRYSDRPGSAGRPILLADVRCLDDHDQPVPDGETGEIVMRGPMVFQGYWNLPEDNAHSFRNGWHHTGDLGRFDPEGYLWYAGRKAEKELIKPGGENVYPAEVEQVILEHSDVLHTVVFGVPDPKWKEAIKAVCVLEAGASLTPESLRDFVGARIARFKRPQIVEFVDQLPLTGDGIPDRDAVKKRYGES